MGCLPPNKGTEEDPGDLLPLAEARRDIYMYEYCRLVKRQPQFVELRERLRKGENLLIIEIDGPHEESLPYYQEKYGVGNDFIQQRTILASYQNLNLMLYDECHSFGHGYCLAVALREWENDFDASLYLPW